MLTEMEKAERRMYDEMWDRERLKKEQRYQDDMRKTREGNSAMTRVLDEQMVRVAQRRAEEKAEREAEIASLHAQWKEADEAAAKAEEARRDREATRIREVKAFNELKAAMDQQRADEEYQEDLKFVTMAMQKVMSTDVAVLTWCMSFVSATSSGDLLWHVPELVSLFTEDWPLYRITGG